MEESSAFINFNAKWFGMFLPSVMGIRGQYGPLRLLSIVSAYGNRVEFEFLMSIIISILIFHLLETKMIPPTSPMRSNNYKDDLSRVCSILIPSIYYLLVLWLMPVHTTPIDHHHTHTQLEVNMAVIIRIAWMLNEGNAAVCTEKEKGARIMEFCIYKHHRVALK